MMNRSLKRVVILSAMAVCLGANLVACGSDKKTDNQVASNGEASDATFASDVFFNVNGAEVKIGAAWSDVQDSLGNEAKPSDKIEPCDGGDYIQMIHYYDGAEITTLRDENVIGVYMTPDGGDVAVMGAVKNGDTVDAVKDALGTPSQEDDSMIVYEIGNNNLMIYLDNGSVSGAMCMGTSQ